MGRKLIMGVARSGGARRPVLAGAMAVLGVIAILAAAAPAMAGLRGDLQRFSNCPLALEGVPKCAYGVTSSGEFVLGKGKVPITVPVILQGGINGSGELVAPTNGAAEISHSPQPVPGGLTGLGLGGGVDEVFAVAELAAPASITNVVRLPLKTKLENPTLGGECYIGTTAEPVILELTYGPLEVSFKDHQITVLNGSLEDHTFSAPGASGCTALPALGDLVVDEKEGLPSPSGKNSAVMTGVTEQVSKRLVAETLPLPAFSRCEKLAGTPEGKKLVYHGAYTDAKCTVASVFREGKYEWLEGAGASNTFSGSSPAVTLETAGGKTDVKCASSSSSGEYTGPKTETETIVLSGCETGPKGHVVSCQSSGAATGEVTTNKLQGGLDFIKENEEGEKPEIGLELKAASGTELVSFECGGSTVSVSGSVVAPITAADSMASTLKVLAKQSGGKQAVEAFEEGGKHTLTFTTSGGEEAGAVNISDTQTNAEKIEVKGTP